MKNLLLVSTSLLALACSSTSAAHVPLPPQDVEISSPNVARIYVIDDPVLSRGLHGVRVIENDRPIGELGAGTYLCWERDPGDCLLEIVFEEMEPMDDDNVTDLVDVALEPGEVYYYGLTIDPLWKRPKVRLLDRAEAREMLKHLNPVQH
jgi:hypothetical protein